MTQVLPRPGLLADWVRRLRAWCILLVMGAAWGLSFSLAKIAATGGVHPIAIAFWESAIAGLLLVGVIILRRMPVSLSWRLLRLNIITGLVGMVIPGVGFFYAASHVPAGILSITVGAVPVLTYVASAMLGLERIALGRIAGVVLGLLAIVLLVGPQGSLPDPGQLPWVFLAVAAAAGYAALNIVLALMAPPGTSSLVLTTGMFATAAMILAPILAAPASSIPLNWSWTSVEWSLIGLGAINALAFALYFYLVDTAGPVFVSLTANLVTLCGVIWGVALFGEQNSIWVWLSLVTLMGALLLIAPHKASRNQPTATGQSLS